MYSFMYERKNRRALALSLAVNRIFCARCFALVIISLEADLCIAAEAASDRGECGLKHYFR